MGVRSGLLWWCWWCGGVGACVGSTQPRKPRRCQGSSATLHSHSACAGSLLQRHTCRFSMLLKPVLEPSGPLPTPGMVCRARENRLSWASPPQILSPALCWRHGRFQEISEIKSMWRTPNNACYHKPSSGAHVLQGC